MKRILFVLTGLAAGFCGLLGCGPEGVSLEGVVPVSGTVTQGGAPLEGAAVTFAPTDGGRTASGLTDENGEFVLTTLQPGDGAMPGSYKVAITKKETVGKEYTEEEANEYYNKHQKQPPAPEIKNLLDEKYADPETSGLTADVPEGGVSDLKFDM
jgi:hypothetical protein